ncbi:MAG: hypothetical protein JEY99_02410 [Spirochaetales bacterium]|nr:hypothetical protein [Spirochaetales bacterium]
MINPRIIVFHYHLLPGGVTSVISTGMEALIEYIPEIVAITLVTGRDENSEKIGSKLRNRAGELGREDLKIEIRCLPETDYDNNIPESADILEKKADHLSAKLLKEFGGSPWWIHNYHIGKNPILTRALIKTAAATRDQRFYLQIHDFPESGRLQNLKGLEGVKPLYPTGPNINYFTINARDRKILIKAGLPSKRVNLMPNPVKYPHTERITTLNDKSRIKERMRAYWGGEFQEFNPDSPLAFYPVRSIRRKNILEAGALALLSEQKINLIVSLPGVSKQENAYSELVHSLFSRGIIPGIWGTGLGSESINENDTENDIPTFDEIASACDVVLSSSLQEGFGYLFVEAAGWGKPLFSRKLDILEEITPILEKDRWQTYEKITVPLFGNMKSRMTRFYKNHISQLNGLLPDELISRIYNDFPKFTAEESENYGVDFSYLPIQLQAEILEKLKSDTEFRKECIQMNGSALSNLESSLKTSDMPLSQKEKTEIENFFGLESFSRRFRSIIEEKETTINRETIMKPKSDTNFGAAVLKAFNSPEYHRPIFQPFTGETL